MFLHRQALGSRSLLLVTGIIALASAGAMLPTAPIPRLSGLAPAAYGIAILGDAATAFVLLSTWKYESGRRSTFAIGLMFAACAIVLLLATLTLPLTPGNPPVMDASAQTGIWLYVFWHVIVAAGAISYLLLRRDGSVGRNPKKFLLTAIGVSSAAVAAAASAAFAWTSHLPTLVTNTSVSGLLSTGVGPAVLVLLVTAIVCVLRISEPTWLDRSLTFSLLAITLEFALFLAGGHRYSASYYAGRILLVPGASFVLLSAIRAFIVSRELQVATLASQRLAIDASIRADRIRAIWEIASKEGPAALAFDAILQTATLAIRPGKTMFGCLSHLDEQRVVIDATSWSISDGHTQQFTDNIFPGASFALDNTLTSRLLSESGTVAWNYVVGVGDDGIVCENSGWRSFIGTTVKIGRKTYFLSFGSPEPMTDTPFAADDKAYIDVVASFFATRFSEVLQFERIQFQVEHDALTGLYNRAQFRNALRVEINRGQRFTVGFVNIDAFRAINERYGQILGDDLLVKVAAGLAGVNADDFVARVNGDEFGILLRDVESNVLTTSALEAYARLFHAPFHTGDREGNRMLKLGASIGAASFPEDGTSAEELMRRADVALHIAKERNGSSTVTFCHEMESILKESHVRLVELADGIANDQLALVYQPTFDLATRNITGAEALVRWDHPERGRLLPAEFIPDAERNGLITSLTRWVLHQLVRDFAGGLALPTGFRVYFNVSAQTLDDIEFIGDLNKALRAAPGLAEHLGIEITETAAMQNIKGAMHTINMLRKWGLSVAIDDFGTGHSSLSYLKQLTVDVIKIDRSFVTGLPKDDRDGAITDMLLQITNRFGLTTLAEGIETEEQARWLLEHGCKFGQGYLVAKPDSLKSLQRHLSQQPKLPAFHRVNSGSK